MDASPDTPDGGGGFVPSTELIPSGGAGGGALDGTLEVHVIDASKEVPIPGARVTVGKHDAITNEAGVARLENLMGSVSVQVEAEDFVPALWQGVESAGLTVLLARADATTSSVEIEATVDGLDELVPESDGATFALRITPSLPEDLDGLDSALARDRDEASCRFAKAASTGCVITLHTRAQRQRLTGIVHSVDADGKIGKPVAVAISSAFAPKADAKDVRISLSLLARDSLLDGVLVPAISPPQGIAAVVGVPGMKLEDGPVLVFPTEPSGEVLLPELGGTLGGNTYWVISQALYESEQEGSVVLRSLRRGVVPEDLSPGAWPTPADAPRIEDASVVLAESEAPLRQISLRDKADAPLLEVTVLGASKGFDLEVATLDRVRNIVSHELHTDFNPKDFVLHDVRAALLAETVRTTAF